MNNKPNDPFQYFVDESDRKPITSQDNSTVGNQNHNSFTININKETLIPSKPSQPEELSPFTLHLKKLQHRVPVVGDKALIDLVNGIQVSAESVRYRKHRGFFGRLMDTLSGSDRQRELLIGGNLIAGQATLHQLILELSNSLDISRVGLEITQQSLEVTQKSLLEARNVIRAHKQSLEELKQVIQHVCNTFETNILRLEKRIAASEDFDKIVTAWIAEETYTDLPWAVQITLLVREIFSSSVSAHELESGDLQYRKRLINKLVAETKHRQIPKTFNGLGDLLDRTWKEMNEMNSEEDRELSVSLLETRSGQLKQVMHTPHLFTVGMALDLSMLTDVARPISPGQCAVELCLNQIGHIENITTPRDFIAAIVEETANGCSAVISLSTVHRRN